MDGKKNVVVMNILFESLKLFFFFFKKEKANEKEKITPDHRGNKHLLKQGPKHSLLYILRFN